LEPNGRSNYIVFEGNVKDQDDLEALVKKEHHGSEIKKSGDYTYVTDGNSSIITWTKSKFYFVSYTRSHASYMDDSDEGESGKNDSLLTYVKHLAGLKKSESVESDDHFSSLVKENGDVHYWLNSEKYYSLIGSSLQNSPMSAMLTSMNRFYKGSFSTGTMSFDDGKITVKTKNYASEEMKKLLDKYKFQNVTKEMVNRIPSKNVIAAMVANFPPDVMKEMAKAMGVDGFINMALGKVNYTFDELIQATKGQFIFAASDFVWPTKSATNMYDEESDHSSMMPDIKLLLGLSVNNKASFDKLVNVLESQIKDSTQKQNLLSKVTYQTTNDWFAISNSSETVQQFLAGGNNDLPFADKISGHAFGMYIDLQKIIKALPGAMAGMSDMQSAAANTWQDMVMTGGDYKDGVTTGELTINLVDSKTNSLKQMNQFIEKMYQAQKKSRAEMEQKYRNLNDSDTTVAPPAPPAQ
jgi:flagellar biosynthesis chaperone FliJ